MTQSGSTKKIPGSLTPISNLDVEARVDKLELKSKADLLELIDRQQKILSNRAFINKLPDKGDKIKVLLEKLQQCFKQKDDVEQSCALFSKMQIDDNTLSKSTVENIEWNRSTSIDASPCLDSDDDEDEDENPLAIIAGNTDAVKKKIIVLKQEESLIKSQDIEEMATFRKEDSTESASGDQHTKYVCEMTVDKSRAYTATERKYFKPYKTTISDVHDPSKEILRKRNKYWEVTAATPPPAIHGPIKEISILDSLKLQSYQNQRLKEVQMKHAAEKLSMQVGKSLGAAPPSPGHHAYRDAAGLLSDDSDNSSDHETSDQEVYDEEPREGGVSFTFTK